MAEHFILSADLTLFFARVLVGSIFLYYGSEKVRNPKENIKEFKDKGFKPAEFWATFIMFLEVIGGAGLIIGILTPLWAALFAAMMAVGTISKIKGGKKFGSWSYDLLILAITLILLVFGAGSFAII